MLDYYSNSNQKLKIKNQKNKIKNDFSKKYLISYNWVGSEKSDEISSLFNISKSKNWREFKNALKTYSVPSMNFSFTDKSGNIGLISCGRTLKRSKNTNPYLPNPGWLPDYDDQGIEKGNILGVLFNPKKKFVSASNNKLNELLIPYISNYWEPDSREKRIEQLIGQYKSYEDYQYNYLDAQRMQLDNYSIYAKDILHKISPILLLNMKNMSLEEQKAFKQLEKWDYLMSAGKTAPTIFKSFINLLAKNIFSDDLGPILFKKYSKMRPFILRKLLNLFNQTNFNFFDNINTKVIESKTYIVVTSFKETVKYLENKFKTKNINKWEFGKINKINLSHEFSNNDFLKSVVNIKSMKLSGDRTSINLIDVPYDAIDYGSIGSSYRMIIDVSDSLMLLSIPGGLSGDPLNPNYKNLVQVWKNGGYIKLNTKRKPDKSFNLKLKGFNKNIKKK